MEKQKLNSNSIKFVNRFGEIVDTEKNICCLCNKEHNNFGNNPWPLSEEGMCCNDCDNTKVIPARFQMDRK